MGFGRLAFDPKFSKGALRAEEMIYRDSEAGVAQVRADLDFIAPLADAALKSQIKRLEGGGQEGCELLGVRRGEVGALDGHRGRTDEARALVEDFVSR